MTVDELVKSYTASLGENIQIARFVRYNMGEEAEDEEEEEDYAAEVARLASGGKKA